MSKVLFIDALFIIKGSKHLFDFVFNSLNSWNYLTDLHMNYTFIPFIKAINQILVICITLALVFNRKEEGLPCSSEKW